MCKGRMFTFPPSVEVNRCPYEGGLTYSQLANYYNEFVIQLRLGEHNLNTAIKLEVKQKNFNESLNQEKEIIKLLNESILPVLGAIVSQAQVAVHVILTWPFHFIVEHLYFRHKLLCN